MIKELIASATVIASLCASPGLVVEPGDVIADNELIQGYATAYDLDGVTASGEVVHEGICASCRSRLGDTILLYQRLPDNSVGELIGIFECKDTGGTEGLNNGTVIDVWQPSIDECQEFMDRIYEDDCHGKVWIQVIFAEG